MKGKTVKAGFMVEIETWENDGDFYATKTLQGLTENDVKFCVEVCEYFDRYGNDIINWDVVHEAMLPIAVKHTDLSSDTTKKLWQAILDCNEDDLSDNISDLLGSEMEDHGCYGDGASFYRTIDSVKVFYTPVDIFLENVTNKFSVN